MERKDGTADRDAPKSWWLAIRRRFARPATMSDLAAPAEAVQAKPHAPEAGAASTRDTFCVLAWNHLQIAPNGTVKMCCIASEDLHEGKRPLSVYTDSYEAIWNSQYMRDARRGLASGEKISPCTRCFNEEDSVGQSRRTIQNEHWLKLYGKTAADFIKEAEAHDWAVEDRPQFLQLNLGNLCNLACRMCSSQYSSRIETDPVHNKWMPPAYMDVARWRGSRLHVGPRPLVGVRCEGFYDYEARSPQALRWSNGHGRIDFPIPAGTRLRELGLTMSLAPGINRRVRIGINGNELFNGKTQGETWTQSFSIKGLDNQSSAEIEIISDATVIGGRVLGVALHDVWVEREAISRGVSTNTRTMMRFDQNAGWWGQPSLMFDELLRDAKKMRRIIFQGGEPLLIKELDDILDYLIRADAAANVTLEIVSNMTTLRDSLLDKLAEFECVELGGSVDGIGGDFEYIRYPAKWPEVEANLRRAAKLKNVKVSVNVAVQLYNLMNITDLLRYCDGQGFDAYTHFLVGPYYLSVLVMPPAARTVALDRLKAYLATGGRPVNRDHASYMIRYLEQHAKVYNRDLVKHLMQFTNDMDVSRNQNFRTSHPELVQFFERDGLRWNPATLHAVRNNVVVS